MIVFRAKQFSSSNKVIQEITQKLEKEKEYNYEVLDGRIPKDSISINPKLDCIDIYLPKDYEFSQYEIDDFIREMLPYVYTTTTYDSGFYHMTVKGGKFTSNQLYKLIKFIIQEGDFCVILDNK